MLIRLVIIFFFAIPSLAVAQESPRITTLEKDQKAPYAGSLLNPAAAAQMIAEKENIESQCSLTKHYIEKKEKAKCDLLVGSVQATLDAIETKYTSILDIKNHEIERLHKIALAQPNAHNHWWLAAGIVAGIVTSVSIFYAAVEVSK